MVPTPTSRAMKIAKDIANRPIPQGIQKRGFDPSIRNRTTRFIQQLPTKNIPTTSRDPFASSPIVRLARRLLPGGT